MLNYVHKSKSYGSIMRGMYDCSLFLISGRKTEKIYVPIESSRWSFFRDAKSHQPVKLMTCMKRLLPDSRFARIKKAIDLFEVPLSFQSRKDFGPAFLLKRYYLPKCVVPANGFP